jgi:hypothetical protein
MVQLYQSPGLIQFLAIEKERERETWQHKRQLVWLQLITSQGHIPSEPSGHVGGASLTKVEGKRDGQWIVSKLDDDEDDDGPSSLEKRKRQKK